MQKNYHDCQQYLQKITKYEWRHLGQGARSNSLKCSGSSSTGDPELPPDLSLSSLIECTLTGVDLECSLAVDKLLFSPADNCNKESG
uniref:Uncharacterized protein n=1 Tax=Romanomermis culicivorax TaxID=13658 RepID=A0A915KHG9_ROMCU